MSTLVGATLCVLMVQTAAPQEETPPLSPLLWRYDFDAACEEARSAGKDLFVNFTGSDWCGWCLKLDAEVFSQPGFKQALSSDYLLVSLDFPRTPAAQALVPDAKRNRELARQYEVGAYPTLLLMTADGDVFGRTGYREGGASEFLSHLEDLRRKGRPPLVAARELAAAIDEASASERAPLVERAVTLLEASVSGSAAARHLARVAEHALQPSAEAPADLFERALRALLASGHSTEPQLARARQHDPLNERGLLELAAHAELLRVRDEAQVREVLARIDELDALGPIRDPAVAKDLYSSAAKWKRTLGRDAAASRRYAAKALPLAGGDEELRKMLEGLLRG